MANGMFKMKMDIDRQGPRLMPNNWQHLDPPYFSIPSTFKRLLHTPPIHTNFLNCNNDNVQYCVNGKIFFADQLIYAARQSAGAQLGVSYGSGSGDRLDIFNPEEG
jgi:hypothetical protein